MGAISLALDITDRIRAEEKKIEMEKHKSVIELAGTICHELSQPLQIITGNSELLLMDKTKEDDESYKKLRKITDQVKRMQLLLQKLLSITGYKTKIYVDQTKIVDLDKSIE